MLEVLFMLIVLFVLVVIQNIERLKKVIKWLLNEEKYFFISTLLAIFFDYIAIKDCDIEMWSSSPKWIKDLFYKSENEDMLLYNLSVNYIVSYMFYFLVNFIPESINEIKRKRELLPIKIAIQIEVREFIGRFIKLWTRIIRNGARNINYDISGVHDIKDLFNLEIIHLGLDNVGLLDLANCRSIEQATFTWRLKIMIELEEVFNKGNTILSRYKGELPSEIFYNIFYIINESYMGEEIFQQIKALSQSPHPGNLRLSECMNVDEESVNKTCEMVIRLYNWVNAQYEYLSEQNISENVECIEFLKYMAQSIDPL